MELPTPMPDETAQEYKKRLIKFREELKFFYWRRGAYCGKFPVPPLSLKTK